MDDVHDVHDGVAGVHCMYMRLEEVALGSIVVVIIIIIKEENGGPLRRIDGGGNSEDR